MTRLEPAEGPGQLRDFLRLPREVYRAHPQHRATDDEIARMLALRRTVFFRHARMRPYLVRQGSRAVARFSLLQDLRNPELLQVALFESLPGVDGLLELILPEARRHFPDCRRLVAGLSGHLNYAAGFLADRFDLPPLFGLPWTPPHYLSAFPGLERREMLSYRFETAPFFAAAAAQATMETGEVRLRTLDRRRLRRDVEIYTALNNACFRRHPYWADRDAEEDYELFHPFRHLLEDEHLILAETREGPVGFLLWYPDFNELVGPGQSLGLRQVLQLRLGRRPSAFRLTEIAVTEAWRNSVVVPAMLQLLARLAARRGYQWCEGGFIFAENDPCQRLTRAMLRRGLGHLPEPFRRYCVFEGPL